MRVPFCYGRNGHNAREHVDQDRRCIGEALEPEKILLLRVGGRQHCGIISTLPMTLGLQQRTFNLVNHKSSMYIICLVSQAALIGGLFGLLAAE